LIGDFVLAGAGEDEAEDRPHRAVALFTEKAGLSGEGVSLTGETSVLGAAISFKADGGSL
jgi:hypothetical protein